MHILLIEDNRAEAELLREQVAAEGDPGAYGIAGAVRFTEARTLAAGLDCLAQGDFDLILSDLTLPDSTGLDTVAALLDAAPALPLVVLTGNELRGLGREAVQRGAEDFLIKRHVNADLLLRAASYARERHELREKIRRMAVIDELTGIYNRRYCFDELQRLVGLTQRHDSPLSLLMIDLYHFKKVNDTHGHQAGDEVLRHAAATMRTTLRGTDTLCRYGGEEFVALLPEIGQAAALQTAERLRATLAAAPCTTETAVITVTVSVGVATWRAGDTDETLLARADGALYHAKEEGRNRCRVAD